jgi:hypothetical protein
LEVVDLEAANGGGSGVIAGAGRESGASLGKDGRRQKAEGRRQKAEGQKRASWMRRWKRA